MAKTGKTKATDLTDKDIQKIRESYKFNSKKAKALDKMWYTVRSILGNTWAIFYILLGGREAGKSYSVMRFFVDQWKRKGIPFTWVRLTEAAQKKLLQNNAAEFIDADIVRQYGLKITVKGHQVYDHGKPMAKVLALSTFYSDKGVALYDNAYDLGYNICLDEMNREANEKKTFDISYAFVNQMENLVRSTKDKVRIFLIGNTLQEASDIMCAFGFIPENFGRYYLHKKRAVVEYMPPSEKYLKRRRGTIADLLAQGSSTFTNQIEVDYSLITKRRLCRPQYVIRFTRDKADWYTVWDGNVITSYNGEQCRIIAMRSYLNAEFSTELRDSVIAQYHERYYKYRDLFTQKRFTKSLELLKPKG